MTVFLVVRVGKLAPMRALRKAQHRNTAFRAA
jgi:hypothetical protein